MILSILALFAIICAHPIFGQTSDEITKWKAVIEQNPNDAKAHRQLGKAYAESGMIEQALDEFEKAIEISYNDGYKKGKDEGVRRENVRFYGKYLLLSILFGLLISAVIVSILSWTEIADKVRSLRSDIKIKAFTKGVGVKLNPELRHRAVEIAQRKEKLKNAIDRERNPALREIASKILPRLDELTKQASLLLELQQNLSDYIKDIDPVKLEVARRECEEKLRKENDKETGRALEYQLKQMNNKLDNYNKAKARLRTTDAVLKGIVSKIDATSLDLMSLPSVLIKKQEFFEKISAELDEEIKITKNATEVVMEEST